MEKRLHEEESGSTGHFLRAMKMRAVQEVRKLKDAAAELVRLGLSHPRTSTRGGGCNCPWSTAVTRPLRLPS